MLVVFHLHKNVSRSVVDHFQSNLKSSNWIISKQCFQFTEYGNSIDGSANFLFGVNVGLNDGTPIQIDQPLSKNVSIIQHLVPDYDNIKYTLIEKPILNDEECETNNFSSAPIPVTSPVNNLTSKVIHRLFYKMVPSPSYVGTSVCQVDHPAPPLDVDTINIFCSLFGIEFAVESIHYVRCISRYEYGKYFGLSPNFNKGFCPKSSNFDILTDGYPERTM